MPNFCSHCGTPVSPEARFCSHCGQPLAQDPSAQTTIPMPQENDPVELYSPAAAKSPRRGGNKRLIAGLLAVVLLTGGAALAGLLGKDDTPPAPGTSSGGTSAPVGSSANPSLPDTPDVPAQPVTVSAAADLSSYRDIPANALPDLHYWSGRFIGYADEPSKGSDRYYYEYGCKTAETRAVFNEYLEALQANGFTLADHYYYSYKGSSFESWGLTCDAAPDAETIGMMYTDTPCHVSIYNDDGIMTFYISPDLAVCDTGLRRDGSMADLRPEGPSIAAGLLRLPDGSYQTSDGRLTAAVGTAMVLRDGVPYTTEAEYTSGNSNDRLNIDGYYRNESIFFRAKAGYLVEGDVLTQREMRQWKQFSKEKADQNVYKYSTIGDLSVAHNGEWESPTYSSVKYAAMDVCSVRVMYMDDGGDAVFYIYARFFEGEPKEIEALAVVSTADDEGAFANATYISPGNTVTLNYPYREYGSNWHTFDWSITEGSGNIRIDAVGDTCTVTALKAGVATVKVSYGYSTEEPDVLTGSPRTVSHTKTEQYYFVIQ